MTPQQRWRERNRAFVNARQRERDRKRAAEREQRPRLIGLAELVSKSAPDECPFCGEPRAVQVTKPHLTCGDEICKAAYLTYHKRDQRAKERMKR